jgi:hypothetical protein
MKPVQNGKQAYLLQHKLPQPSLECSPIAPHHDLLDLLPWQLQQRSVARHAEVFGASNEAFPELGRGPDLLGDEAREEVGGDKGGEGFVGLDGFDDLGRG